jgi:hypothetical protein
LKYVQLCDGILEPKAFALLQREQFLTNVLGDGWEGLRRARRLLREMIEGISVAEVRAQLEAKQFEVILDRHELRIFEPATFKVRFFDKGVDSSTARQEWLHGWNFGHGPDLGGITASNPPSNDAPSADHYIEEGMSVCHYFPAPGRYRVFASFRHETGGQTSADGYEFRTHKDVLVWGQSKGRWAGFVRLLQDNLNEGLRLVLALTPVILGLLAGAKDQLLKLDPVLALAAVFLAGFGSDQVKNLLSQKPPV